jgi:hypothetical protein
VTVTPTLDPLPLGMCGAVHLTLLDPVTRDVPRNPQGYRINMADFDMTVSGGTSAAGHQIDASHFEACGCQGGAAGSTVTVTARYPAQALPAAKRVPGVSIQQSATFVLALPKGTVNPQSCVMLAAGAAASGGASAVGTAGAAGASGAAGPGAQAGAAQSGAAAPAAAQGGVAGAAAAGGAPAAAGAAQSPDARAGTGAAGVARAGAAGSAGTGAPSAGNAATGTPAPAVVPVNPSKLDAGQIGPGQVALAWPPIPGASFYVVFGPGLTQGGHRVENQTDPRYTGTPFPPQVTAIANNVPAGTHEWLVASYYSPGNISTPASQYTRASVTVTAPEPASVTTTSTPAPAAAAPASGKYLVTITGVRVYQASMDDMLSRDGMGDEIYAAAYVRRYDRNSGDLLDASMRQSASHGDVTNFGNQRLQAGTKSQTGGIHDGDMIPGPALITTRNAPAQEVTFPLRLWTGTLTDGVDALIITPSLWEQDGSDAFYAKWAQFQQTLNLSLLAKQGVQEQIAQKAFGSLIFGMSGNDANAAGSSVARTIVDVVMMFGGGGIPIVGLLTTSADRPLGIVQNGRDQTALPNHTLVLTREIIEAALARPPLGSIASPVANLPSGGMMMGGIPPIARIGMVSPKPGVVVVQFQDRDVNGTLAFPERPAIYQMFIQVERVP